MAVTAQLAGIKLTHVTYRGRRPPTRMCWVGASISFSISPHRTRPGRCRQRAGSGSFLQGAPAHASGGAKRRGDGRGGARYGKLVWPVRAGGRACANALARLRAELAKVLAAEVAALFAKTGGRLLTLSPPETEALIRRDVQRWTKLDPRGGDQRRPMRL